MRDRGHTGRCHGANSVSRQSANAAAAKVFDTRSEEWDDRPIVQTSRVAGIDGRAPG